MSENVRTLVINSSSLQTLEDFINSEEDTGMLLNQLGIISDDELAAAVHMMEDFRVKVEADPSLAEAKAKELNDTGNIAEIEAAEEGASS